jgi:tetratricopeptide (TPR) repeat protein
MIPLLLVLTATLPGPQAKTPAPAPAPAPGKPAAQAPAQATPAPQAAPAGKIVWTEKDIDGAFKDAQTQSKLVMAYFASTSITASTLMSKEALQDDAVAEALKDVICVKIDLEKQRSVAARFGAQDAPIFIWFNSDGTARDRIGGYKDARTFLGLVSQIKLDLGTINELRKKVAAKGDDIELRFQLYKRLREVGDIGGASEQKAAIIKLDPQGTSRASHHFTYDRITGEIEQFWSETGTLAMHKIEELQTFIELESDPELLWDGWMRLANTHAYLANQAAGKGQFADAKDQRATRRTFITRAWRGVPQEPEVFREWCITNSELFWNERDELTPADKEFAMTMTGKFVEMFDKDALAHDLHARFLYYTGQRPQAIDESQKAVELDPTKSDYKARLTQYRGD